MKQIYALLLTFTFAISAHATDVIQIQSGELVKVELRGEDDHKEISFQFCERISGKCEALGSKDWYSVSDLKSQRTIEILQVAATAGGDVAIAAGFVVAGIYMIEPLGTLALVLAPYYFTSQFLFDAVNPLVQLRQARSVRNAVIQDKTVIVKDIRRYAEALNDVLLKL